MTDRDLPTLLRELHAELEKNTSLDDTTRGLVSEVRVDLERALAQADTDAHRSLGARLRGSIQHFEERHPELVSIAQRVLNQLSDIGI